MSMIQCNINCVYSTSFGYCLFNKCKFPNLKNKNVNNYSNKTLKKQQTIICPHCKNKILIDKGGN